MSKITDGFDIGMYSDQDVRRLLAHARALEEMLKEHEFDGYNCECLECLTEYPNHSPDCALAKLLE